MYTLLNCIFESEIETIMERNRIPEMDYLTQICFELFESEPKSKNNFFEQGEGKSAETTKKYAVKITISPGCHSSDPLDLQLDSKHCIGCAPRRALTKHLDINDELMRNFKCRFSRVNLPKRFTPVNISNSSRWIDIRTV